MAQNENLVEELQQLKQRIRQTEGVILMLADETAADSAFDPDGKIAEVWIDQAVSHVAKFRELFARLEPPDASAKPGQINDRADFEYQYQNRLLEAKREQLDENLCEVFYRLEAAKKENRDA